MKTLIMVISLIFCRNLFAQKFDYNSLPDTCNQEYVFDYRMIYGDYESNLTDLLEIQLGARYGVWVEYFGPETQDPREMLISVSLIDNTEINVFIPVCIAEELFQNNVLIEYVQDKSQNWDTVRQWNINY